MCKPIELWRIGKRNGSKRLADTNSMAVSAVRGAVAIAVTCDDGSHMRLRMDVATVAALRAALEQAEQAATDYQGVKVLTVVDNEVRSW